MNTSTVNIMTTTIPVVAAMTIITTTSMLAAVAMITTMIMLMPMTMQVAAVAVATTMVTRKTKALASNSAASSAYLRSKFGPS